MKKYEIVYILDPALQDTTSIIQKINNLLTQNEGKIIDQKEWGMLDLAYPICKKQKGNYFILIAKTDAANIISLKKLSQVNKSILRIFILNAEKQKHYKQSTELNSTKITPEEFKVQIMGPSYQKRFSKTNTKQAENKEPAEDISKEKKENSNNESS